MSAPEIGPDTPFHTAIGAAHYWHDQWARVRWWKLAALASLAFNVGQAAAWLYRG